MPPLVLPIPQLSLFRAELAVAARGRWGATLRRTQRALWALFTGLHPVYEAVS